MSDIPEEAVKAGLEAALKLDGSTPMKQVVRDVLKAARPYTQPDRRTVTSIEELRALPPDTIVRDKHGGLFELGDDPDELVLWVLATADYWRKGDDVLMDNGPFDILYEPEEAAVKVVYAPPPSRYVVQLRSEIADWENDQGFQSLLEAKEHADKSARMFPNLQVRVIEVSDQ